MALAEQEESSSNEIAINEEQVNHVNILENQSQDNGLIDIKPLGSEDFCNNNPEFAVICSFITQFGDKIDIDLNIERLMSAIEDLSQVDNYLIDLHVKLLKKLRRYFVRDQWEKALIRFASEYSYEHAYEIESLGYQKTRPSIKLELLRRLLDVQFECDPKFKAAVNLCEANDLRVTPIGRDIKGNTYWEKNDDEGNFRLYQEEPLNYKSWKTVCTNVTELQSLITNLDQNKDNRVKGEPMTEPYNPFPEIFPEFFEKVEILDEPNEIKTVSKGRKGRHRGRRKQTKNPLSILEEENDQDKTNQSNNISDIPKIETSYNETKSMLPTCNGLAKKDVDMNCENASTESQVKSVLENVLNMVVSSIEFIMRPLSRNSNREITEEMRPEPPRKKPASRKKREKPPQEAITRRSSSRIQQLQQKKQEEEVKKKFELEKKRSLAKATGAEIISNDEDSRTKLDDRLYARKSEEFKSNKRRRKKAAWRKGKGKKKLSWDQDDSDLSSMSSLTESEDDFEEANFNIESNIDDEFACEDEDTNNEPVIVRRARTAKQNVVADETGDLNNTTLIEEDKPCGRCDKSNDPEWILLCDMCDDGYHTSCCLPPLMIVPDGDWYCPSCEHKTLLTKLTELHSSVCQILTIKKEEQEKEEKEKKKKQAAMKKKQPVKEVLDQQIQNPELLERTPKDILNEVNDPIALQRLDECLELSDTGSISGNRPKKKFKKSRNGFKKGSRSSHYDDLEFRRPKKTYSRNQYSESEEEDYSYDEIVAPFISDDGPPKPRRARASVNYKFKEYDDLIKSAIRGESAEEVTSGDDNNEQPESQNYGRGKDMATIQALAYQQENGLPSHNAEGVQQESKPRRKGRRLNDLETSTEEENITSDESFQASSATEAEDAELTEANSSEETDISFVIHKNKDTKHEKSKRRKKTYSRNRFTDSEEEEFSNDELISYSSEDGPPKPRRARASVSYKFKEYDNLIESAINGESAPEVTSEEEDEKPKTQSYGRGKDMATIQALAYQQENGLLPQDSEPPVKKQKARRKARRLNDLDALTDGEDITSDESFQASASEANDAELTEEGGSSEETDISFDEIVSNH